MDEKYYKLLKEQFVSKEAVLTEIINLSAICELPKGTEHFVSDIQGNTMLLIMSCVTAQVRLKKSSANAFLT